jgi:hypothetical protein
VAGGGLLSAILSERSDEELADLRRQLLKRIANAREALTQAERELRLVEQAMVARGGRQADTTAVVSDDAAANERDRRSDGRFQGIPRARVLAVATTVTPPITPIRVVDAFAERGETVNLEQIRIALNRIAKDGDLRKTGASVFALPAAVSEPQPRPAEAPPEPPADATDAPSPFRRGGLGTGVTSTWRGTT